MEFFVEVPVHTASTVNECEFQELIARALRLTPQDVQVTSNQRVHHLIHCTTQANIQDAMPLRDRCLQGCSNACASKQHVTFQVESPLLDSADLQYLSEVGLLDFVDDAIAEVATTRDANPAKSLAMMAQERAPEFHTRAEVLAELITAARGQLRPHADYKAAMRIQNMAQQEKGRKAGIDRLVAEQLRSCKETLQTIEDRLTQSAPCLRRELDAERTAATNAYNRIRAYDEIAASEDRARTETIREVLHRTTRQCEAITATLQLNRTNLEGLLKEVGRACGVSL